MSDIRKAYVDTPGGQLHFRYVRGPGVPLLLFHRTPVDSSCFDGLLTKLAGTRGLYAFDTPGFGGSFKPKGAPEISQYRDWMIAAIDGLAIDRFHLFAHHTGTHIATEIAAALPKRAASLMVNGAMFIGAEERAAFRTMVKDPDPIDAEGAYQSKCWALVKSFFPTYSPELVHTEFVGAMRSIAGRKQAFDMLFKQDYPAVLARVRCPIFAMAAEDDPLRAFLDRIPAALPHVRTQVLGSAGIAAPELDTERLATEIRAFLDDVERA